MALTPTQVEQICDGLASGNSLRSICREMGLPQSTVRYALKADPDAFAQTARARELGCDALADECIEISDNKDLDPADRRVRIETRLKLLGKWSQRYGDKVDHTLSGPDGGPVQVAHANISDLAATLRAAVTARTAEITAAPSAPQIEAVRDKGGKDLL